MQIYGAAAVLFIFSAPQKRTIFDDDSRNQYRPLSSSKEITG